MQPTTTEKYLVYAIRCIECGGEARFVRASRTEIKRKDIEYFKKNKNFEYVRTDVKRDGFFSHNRHHGAWFYRELGYRIPANLPDGYHEGCWRVPKYYYERYGRNAGVRGSHICLSCGKRCKHNLDWPSDAFFQIEYAGQTLWAYHRDYLLALIEFLKSEDRAYNGRDYGYLLRKVPTHFKTAKARKTVIPKLEKLLQE